MSAEIRLRGLWTPTRVRVVDESLARLGRGAARLRLRVGEALHRLSSTNGYAELGFSSSTAYARERCERGARWAADSRVLARRLSSEGGRGLSIIRRALIEGSMLWSMAEELSAHATEEDEAELVARAQGLTVRQMKAWLRRRGAGEMLDADGHDDWDSRDLRVDIGFDELAIVEATRFLVAALDDAPLDDERFLEALLAEGESALTGLEQGRAPTRSDEVEEAARLRSEELLREARLREEVRVEGRIPGVAALGSLEGGDDVPLGSTARDLDAEIRRCCVLLARRDLEMGRLCRTIFERRCWRNLGYASEEQYARERVGVSLSSLRHRCTLARRADRLPALARALEAGAVGYEATMLVGRVATAETVEAWIERAKARTLKHLREEVAAVELRARLGDEGPFLPPGDAEVEAVATLERAALSGELFEQLFEAKPPGRQISVRAGSGRLLRLRVSGDLLAYFHRLRARFNRVAPPAASFIGFLGLAVWDAWLPAVRGGVGRWLRIHLRDRYRCCSPVCSRRDVTPHHLEFQSHGGGDEDENMASLCSWCHLEGIHQGRLRASPPASRVRWLVGRSPIMMVDGRERILLSSGS